MEYVFGVEGGGTKTTGALSGVDGEILNIETGGPSNFLIIGVEKASENILNIYKTCLQKTKLNHSQLKSIMLGLTGAGRISDQEKMKSGFQDFTQKKGYIFDNVIVDSDARISLEGAFPGKPGMILISGTGSIMYGKDKEGNLIRVGGWGRLLGDEGSGFVIGKRGLNAVTQHIDGRKKRTKISDLISDKFNLNSLESIVSAVYKENFDIASIAPMVFEAAEQNDETALEILNEAVSDLFVHVFTMYNKLGLKGRIGLSFVGSLLTNDTFVSEKLIQKIYKELPEIIVQAPEREPVYGAILMAIKSLKK